MCPSDMHQKLKIFLECVNNLGPFTYEFVNILQNYCTWLNIKRKEEEEDEREREGRELGLV